MSELKEYIVSCKNKQDLDSLYDDMETPGGNLYIPDRAVELVHRRAISRNTHYMLTEEEAEQVRNDPRVIFCQRPATDLGIVPTPFWSQTADFNKTTGTFASDDKNWGLYRVIEGDTVANWGSDNTAEITNRTIVTTSSGKNVDVVIVDAHINPDHPEFAVNPDGTGGSRVNQFNWFQYSSALGYSTPATYTYSTSGASPNSNHGTHVAGTACGNTQGWARDANIYNMAFLDSLSGVLYWDEKMWDYLRYFHLNKAINPDTGRKNPTITNHSWGYSWPNNDITEFTNVRYQGTDVAVSGTILERKSILEANGCPIPLIPDYYEKTFQYPSRWTPTELDIQDAIDEGVIIIAAAGNDFWMCDIPGGQDYDNHFQDGILDALKHSRGSTPGSADNVICVGSIGSKVAEYKSWFSNYGPRVDVWAPGSDIISAVYDNTTTPVSYNPIIADSRNSSYYLASINGTSMACPQVTGVIACLAELEPNLTQAEALQYLKETSLAEVGDQGGNPNQSPYEGFGGSNNRYLFYKNKRPLEGQTSPNVLNKNRNPDTAGVKYPRTRNKVFKPKA